MAENTTLMNRAFCGKPRSYSNNKPGRLFLSRYARAFTLIFLVGFLSLQPGQASGKDWTLQSVSGELTLDIRSDNGAGPAFRVSTPSGTVVDWSPLGLVLSSQDSDLNQRAHDFSQDLTGAESEVKQVCDAYRLKIGKRLENKACANQLTLSSPSQDGLQLSVQFRAYDDGVAFRYLITSDNGYLDSLFYMLKSELTGFNMSHATKVFPQPYDHADSWRPSYEAPALSMGDVVGRSTPQALGAGWSMPLLFEVGGDWVLIHESGLVGQSYGSHIAPEVVDKIYRLTGPLVNEALGHGDTSAHFALPWKSPWRVLIVGDLPTVVQSNLVQTLAPPAAVDADWVKPGRASWSWLSDHDSSQDPVKLKTFIDLAADMGWEYSLIDANWNRFSKEELARLITHAKQRNVGLFLWYNSGGSNNAVTEAPRNLMADRSLRRAEFERISGLGIRGIKVDFWHSDKQYMIKRYVDLLLDAAEFKLLVNFHGSTIPRGWERTFPNLVTMEAIRGHEFYTFPSEPNYGELAPSQNALVPFTRNVIGPMDSTPVIFAPKLISRLTTNGHEAALGIIYESGVQHFSDDAGAYSALPEAWKSYLRSLPSAWDETRLLAGYPGKYVVMARRKGERWWVGAINGTSEPRKLDMDLSFIAGDLIALGDKDGEMTDYRFEQSTVITLEPYGGIAIYPTSSQ